MAKKAKKEASGPKGAPGWMVTYGDMMTLLLTFFVLILSFSSVQEAEFKKAMGSLLGALGILGKEEYIISLGQIIVPEARFSFMSRRPMMTTGELSRKLNFVSDYDQVEVYQDNRGVNIILPAEILFDAGTDTVKVTAYPLLKKIAAFLFELKNNIIVEGYTDTTPINSLQFPSNWHLSSARAISVARLIHEFGDIDNARIAVCGYGEYRPVAPNDTEENRKKNRRVAIVVEGTEGA